VIKFGINFDLLPWFPFVQSVFKKYGRVIRTEIREGHGIVTLDSERAGEEAIKHCTGIEICGQAITVTWEKTDSGDGSMYALLSQSYSRMLI